MGSKTKATHRNFVMEIGKGVLAALVIAVISACVFAFLVERQSAAETSIGIWGYATLTLASLVGSLISSGRIGEKRVIVCAVMAAVFAFLLLLTGILVFDGNMHGLGGNLVSILIGAGISSLLSMKKPGRKVKIKRRSC